VTAQVIDFASARSRSRLHEQERFEAELSTWPERIRETVAWHARHHGLDRDELRAARSGESVHLQDTPASAIRYELRVYRRRVADWRRARSRSWKTMRWRSVYDARARLLRALWLYGIRKLDAEMRGARERVARESMR
jgi:hypothetical protein